MRKFIIIASIILVLILFVIIAISRQGQPSTVNKNLSLTPTSIVIETQTNQKIINTALPMTPYEDENFKFDFSTNTNQFIVQEKTPQAKEKFNEWLKINGLTDLAGNPEVVVYQKTTTNQSLGFSNQSLDMKPINNFLNIFLNFGQGKGVAPSQESDESSVNNNQAPASGFVYFAQCDSEYADIALPDGCTMCEAGCGAATVSMIASSYLGNTFNPRNIVNMYKSRDYLLSCSGSRWSDAKSLLQSLGLKTTDYITFNSDTADKVVPDLKKYLNSGWTFFTLADFKEGGGGGHYFWITDIDNKGNIWAYDPYYGRFEAPPLNENSRYPFPKYLLAFGVKK